MALQAGRQPGGGCLSKLQLPLSRFFTCLLACSLSHFLECFLEPRKCAGRMERSGEQVEPAYCTGGVSLADGKRRSKAVGEHLRLLLGAGVHDSRTSSRLAAHACRSLHCTALLSSVRSPLSTLRPLANSHLAKPNSYHSKNGSPDHEHSKRPAGRRAFSGQSALSDRSIKWHLRAGRRTLDARRQTQLVKRRRKSARK